LEQRAASERAADNFAFLGFLEDRRQLPILYRAADVFCSPADHEVGVANVYIEAMAAGCPVIAANTGGAPEAVLDRQTGLLVPPRDAEALGAALDEVLSDTALQRGLGAAGRKRAES